MNLDDYLTDDEARYYVNVAYSTWLYDESGAGLADEDHGWEEEGGEYTAEELRNLLEDGGFYFPSVSGPHGPHSASTWLACEPWQDPATGYRERRTVHLAVADERACELWGLLLNQFDITQTRRRARCN